MVAHNPRPPFGIGYATIRVPLTKTLSFQVSGDNIFNAWTALFPTVGGGIAVRDLIDRVSWMRKFRGEQVYAVVSPSAAPMKTRHGTRLRQHFVIKRWIGLSSDGSLPLTEPHDS